MTISSESILVLGAGELGAATLSALVSHPKYSSSNIKLSVLLRPSSQPNLPSESIKIVRLDLVTASEAELADAFRNFQTVISCTGFAGGSGTQLKLARAAIFAKVERYFPWQFGVDYDAVGKNSGQDLFDEQLVVRDLLRGQDVVKWVIVSTGIFTSFIFEPSFGVVDLKENSVRPLGEESTKVTVTSPKDIGTVVAELVFVDTETNGFIYTAGDTIAYGDLLPIVQQVTGSKPRVVDGSIEILKRELEQDSQNTMKKYRVAFARGIGVSWDVGKTYNAQKAIPMESVQEYAKINLTKAS